MSEISRGAASVHFTRAWIVRPFVRFLEAHGCPAERFLIEASIAPDLLEDDQAAVPLRFVVNFVERASRREGIDHLGLRVAQTLTPEDLGGLQILLARARTLHEYLQMGCRLASSITTNVRYGVTVRGDEAVFHHTVVDSDHPLHSHLFGLGLTINTFRAIAGGGWQPADVVVPYGEAEGLAAISDAFDNARGDPAARAASFTFPLGFLTVPVPALSRPHGLDSVRALEALDTGGFHHMVRRLVESLVLDGLADVHTAADAARISVRSFQRRLTECGLTFSQLAGEARIAIAERWLLQRGRPVADIACSLGYRDPANFTRAFRRANGVAPSVFRRLHSETAPGPLVEASAQSRT